MTLVWKVAHHLRALSPRSRPAPSAQRRSRYLAHIEGRSGTILMGWAINCASPSQVFNVTLMLDGFPCAQSRNDLRRGDLEDALGTPEGVGGLAFYLPDGLRDAPAHIACSLRLPDGSETPPVQVMVRGPLPPFPRLLARQNASLVIVTESSRDIDTCLSHVCRFTQGANELVLVSSNETGSNEMLRSAATRPGVRIINVPPHTGPVSALTMGIAATEGPNIVALSQASRVQPGWLSGLETAMARNPAAGLCLPLSEPWLEAKQVGLHQTSRAISIARNGLSDALPVLTGPTHCVWIRRACLEDLGGLEAYDQGDCETTLATFGLAAGRAGWPTVLAERSIVSLGTARLPRTSRISRRFPEASARPANSSRLNYRAATAPAASLPRVIFVTAAGGGGIPHTNADLMQALDGIIEPWLLKIKDGELELSCSASNSPHLARRAKLPAPIDLVTLRCPAYERTLEEWLESLNPQLVHIREIMGHSIRLPALAHAAGAAVVLSFHDYFSLCPTVKLIDGKGKFCGGRCTIGKGDCRPAQIPGSAALPPLRDAWVHRWRKIIGDGLGECDAFVTTAASARDRMLEQLPSLERRHIDVIPHGRVFTRITKPRQPREPTKPLKILVAGNLDEAKGVGAIQALLRYDVQRRLEIHVLGTHRFYESDRIIDHGPYQRDQFVERARDIEADVGAIFSIWDETWCHVLTEMWAAGLPTVVLDQATVSRRVNETGAGWVLPTSHVSTQKDLQAIYRTLLDIAENPVTWSIKAAAVARWQRHSAGRTTAIMAAHYLQLYKRALARRERSHPGFATKFWQDPPLLIGVVGAARDSRLANLCTPSLHRSIDYLAIASGDLSAVLSTNRLSAVIAAPPIEEAVRHLCDLHGVAWVSNAELVSVSDPATFDRRLRATLSTHKLSDGIRPA